MFKTGMNTKAKIIIFTVLLFSRFFLRPQLFVCQAYLKQLKDKVVIFLEQFYYFSQKKLFLYGGKIVKKDNALPFQVEVTSSRTMKVRTKKSR
jgi:hypothetical protein